MQALFDFQQNMLSLIKNDLRRYLHHKIDWNQRMIAIKGSRGAGKTTLMLQHLKFDLGSPAEALYVTADHPWFYTRSLFDTVSEWSKMNGKWIFIDEVHKYPNWSNELKNIYDGFPRMQVVFTASSALEIYRGKADLSRRVLVYDLPGLSFREYLNWTTPHHFDACSLNDIKNHHPDYARQVLQHLHPLPAFSSYLKNGYLPIFLEGSEHYLSKVLQIINVILDVDLAYTESIHATSPVKIKKLLGVIAESVPFKPNISSLSRKLDLSRETVYHYLDLLEKSGLINQLTTEVKGSAVLQKPEKIYLENTNLAWALSETPDTGNIRETFVLNQLRSAGLTVTAPPAGDFRIGQLTIEAGGANKSNQQVSHLPDYLLAIDNIETGFGHRIPLWLLGFMY